MSPGAYPDLIVLGAGPCGLAAAWHAREAGMRVQLLDAGPEPGGRMRTETAELDGRPLVVERGPLAWVGPAPETEAACQALGLEVIASEAADSHRYLLHDGALLPYPQDAGKLATSRALSVREKMRAAAEKWADFAPDGKEETVHEFFSRRFGEGFAEKLVAPVIRGLFADDARTTSIQALLPQVAAAELKYGSISKALKSHPELFGQQAHTVAGGLGRFAAALAAPLGDDYLPNCQVDTAIREQGWWFLYRDGERIATSRRLAVCLPPRELGIVLREYLTGGPDATARFAGADLATVSMLYRRDEVEDACAGFGILVPPELDSATLSVQFVHAIFPQHVPDGSLLIRGMLGGDADPTILARDDDELVAELSADLRPWLGVPERPQRAWVARIPGGVPHYGIGHERERLELLKQLAVVGDLHLGGDAWFGIGIEAALRRGAEIGRAVSGGEAVSPAPAPTSPDSR